METPLCQTASLPNAAPQDGGFAEHAAEDVLRMLAAGTPGGEVLTLLAREGEVLAGPGAVVSILVLDENGLLRNGASPNLPADYLAAIDRLAPHPGVGTCAAAAATGNVVVTQDFRADDKWAELRHLPLALGFLGAWSMPIKSSNGTVLGTFGTYFRESRSPTAREQQGVERLALAAARVLACA
ncbi:MAG: GAF domain-containing protein [Prosthecobacter sp.]